MRDDKLTICRSPIVASPYRDWLDSSWVSTKKVSFPVSKATPFQDLWSTRRSSIFLYIRKGIYHKVQIESINATCSSKFSSRSTIGTSINITHRPWRVNPKKLLYIFSIMLSHRGQAYAESGLMTGYLRDKKESYSKQSNPHGEVSFANAENVWLVLPLTFILTDIY